MGISTQIRIALSNDGWIDPREEAKIRTQIESSDVVSGSDLAEVKRAKERAVAKLPEVFEKLSRSSAEQLIEARLDPRDFLSKKELRAHEKLVHERDNAFVLESMWNAMRLRRNLSSERMAMVIVPTAAAMALGTDYHPRTHRRPADRTEATFLLSIERPTAGWSYVLVANMLDGSARFARFKGDQWEYSNETTINRFDPDR